MIVYKVVTKDMKSVYCPKDWELKYKLNKITKPKRNTVIFAFADLNSAIKFETNVNRIYTRILKCKARKSKIDIDVMMYGTIDNSDIISWFWRNYRDIKEEVIQAYSTTNILSGTILCSSITPIEEVKI